LRLALWLCAPLLAWPSPPPWASSTRKASADGGRPPAAARDGRPDAGTVANAADNDAEVIENLELLEHLDESRDLDLLLELSKEEGRPAK